MWPLSLWLPFATYRATHLRHHQDANLTDPFEDPESYYWTAAGWRDLGPLRARSGAGAVDPARTPCPRSGLDDHARSSAGSFARPGATSPAPGRVLSSHLVQCAPVLIWVIGVCGMPFWVYVAAFVYPGMSLGDGALLRRAPGGSEAEERTAIVENAAILGPLFLFNNLHVAHHMRGGLPWYQIPKFYRLNRAALIERNGGLVYNGYFDVARRYLLKPHDGPLHPGLEPARGMTGGAPVRGAADVRLSGDGARRTTPSGARSPCDCASEASRRRRG